MKVYLDQTELPGVTGDLADAIDAASLACRRSASTSSSTTANTTGTPPRLIVDVFVDDLRIDDPTSPDAARRWTASALSHATIRCATVDPVVFVRDLYLTVDEVLDRINGLQSEAAEQIQRGDLPAGLDSLSNIMALWDHVQQAVQQGSSLIGDDLDAMKSTEPLVAAAIDSLAEKLHAVKSALSAEDWVSLADTVGYDMGPVAENWRAFVAHLVGRLQTSKS